LVEKHMNVEIAGKYYCAEVLEQRGNNYVVTVEHLLPRLKVARSKLSPITNNIERERLGLKPYSEMYANMDPAP